MEHPLKPVPIPHSIVPEPAHASCEAMQYTDSPFAPQLGNQFMPNVLHPGVLSQNAAQMATLSLCVVSLAMFCEY